MSKNVLLETGVRVINIGLAGFARDIGRQDAPVVHVEWSPPAKGDPKLRELLVKLGS